jgi:hypothetical protein
MRTLGQFAGRVVLSLVAAAFLTACVAESSSPPGRTRSLSQTSNAPPRLATYRCGTSGSMTIEIRQGSAHITDPSGEEIDVAASPPGQLNRFSDQLNALVIEGAEAFWMANRKTPITCRR